MKIDQVLFEKRVSKAKKDKIAFNAKMASRFLSEFSMVRFTSEIGEEINDIEKSSYLTGSVNAVSKYRQLYMLHVIRYWVDLLRELQYKSFNKQIDIPHFTEIFAIFNNDDKYFLTRKTFGTP